MWKDCLFLLRFRSNVLNTLIRHSNGFSVEFGIPDDLMVQSASVIEPVEPVLLSGIRSLESIYMV